jgi:hypothetical protein
MVYKTTICFVKFMAMITKYFRNRVLGRLFGHKRVTATGGRKKADKFHQLNRAAKTVTVTKSTRMKRTRYVAGKRDAGNTYKILAGTSERTRLPEKSGREGDENIKMDITEISSSLA